jgi:hypothetical protein
MAMTLKKLPLGSHSFATIRDSDYLYADKTKLVYELVRGSEQSYFLSRPRRFGKSLLLSTFDELFSGNRERFRGLWIDGSDYAFPRHPVIFHSLSVSADNSEVLEKNIISTLQDIATNEKLVINEITPDMYLSTLIQALYEKYNSPVVVLIDEYDSPVTDYMDDLEVARANAKVLREYFAALKKPDVSPFLRFTFVTGITRYALASMDSGPSHLTDISLDPEFSDLCGFTPDEFDLLFADRMKETLDKFKDNKDIAGVKDLRTNILSWYDGYSWGGQTRVLNPYTILNFFRRGSFGHYWILSGRPAHLTALIKEKPADFINPTQVTNSYTELTKSELTHLEAAPVLFHSGYLTIDKVNEISRKNKGIQKEDEKSYSFKFPNYEVASSYARDCLNILFNFKSFDKTLQTKGTELQKAFLAGDGKAVSDIITWFFSTINCYQRPDSETSFHSLIQMLLSVMGFEVLSEIPGATSRLDLCLKLSDQVYLIIELKYCPTKGKLTKKEKNRALATMAMLALPKKEQDKCLADLVIAKVGNDIIHQIQSPDHGREMTMAEKYQALAEEAFRISTKEDREQALADMARDRLTGDEIEANLEATAKKKYLGDPEKIDRILTDAARKALLAIAEKGYTGVLGHKPQKTIELGLAISGYGSKIKAAFGPADPQTGQQRKARSDSVKSKR